MTAVGPVCHIPPKVITTPQPAPLNLPSIPPAGPTLDSLMHTVNAMRQVIIILSGQRGAQGAQGAQGAAAKKTPPVRWSEAARTVETVRIFDPNDHTVFVDVERINNLTMKDGVTGEQWTWDRDRK